MNDKIFDELYSKVLESLNSDEIPVGAVIFDDLGNIISSAGNTRQTAHYVLGHAEINAIIKAEKEINDWRLDGYSMLVNLEPCDMCSTIIKECRLDQVYYLIPSNNSKSSVKINKIKLDDEKYKESVDKYKDILSTYFKNKR